MLNIFCWYFLIYYWVQVSSKVRCHCFTLGTILTCFHVNIRLALKLKLKISMYNFTCIIILMFDNFAELYILLKDFELYILLKDFFSRVSVFMLLFLISSWKTLIIGSCSRLFTYFNSWLRFEFSFRCCLIDTVLLSKRVLIRFNLLALLPRLM